MATIEGAPPVFDRRPYKVEYYKDGVKQVINRRPPPKLHPILPEDVVTIRRKRNDDWQDGDEVEVTAIGSRQPNTLQVKNDRGQSTFLPFFDVEFEGRDEGTDVVANDARARRRDPIGSDYLLWP
jgi:hypothetical protein